MEGETAIEKSIKSFVFNKIQEQIYLDVSRSNTVSIRHRSQHGSIALAMFWLRVFRHQNNYPMPKYPYKQLYDKNGNNKVILKVDDVTLTTYMCTGTLVLQGVFVLEWFLHMFPVIMEAYDAPIKDPQPQTTVYRQYTENWKKLQGHYKEREGEEAEKLRLKEERALAILDDRSTIISDVDKATDAQTHVVADNRLESEKLLRASTGLQQELAEELELMTVDVWPASTLDQQLTNLRTCCVRDGATYIYRLWKSLLHHWFADPQRKVYIVTPCLDTTRLVDICQIILEHRNQANLDAFFVRQQCDQDGKIFEVKQNALNKFDAKDQMFLEYKIYTNIIYPMKRFDAKFIACTKGDTAEVLVTSAGFHGDHFDHSNMETVQYQTMSDVEFIRGFLCPINASVHKQE